MTSNKNELFGFSEQQLETMIEEDLTKNELYNLAQERRFYINDLKQQINGMKNCLNCAYISTIGCKLGSKDYYCNLEKWIYKKWEIET